MYSRGCVGAPVSIEGFRCGTSQCLEVALGHQPVSRGNQSKGCVGAPVSDLGAPVRVEGVLRGTPRPAHLATEFSRRGLGSVVARSCLYFPFVRLATFPIPEAHNLWFLLAFPIYYFRVVFQSLGQEGRARRRKKIREDQVYSRK